MLLCADSIEKCEGTLYYIKNSIKLSEKARPQTGDTMNKSEEKQKKLWYLVFAHPFVRDFILVVIVAAIFLYRGLSHVSLTTLDFIIIAVLLILLLLDRIQQFRRNREPSEEENRVSLKERGRDFFRQDPRGWVYLVAVIVLLVCSIITITHNNSLAMFISLCFLLFILLYGEISNGNTPFRRSLQLKNQRLPLRQRSEISVSDAPHDKMNTSYFITFIVCAIGLIVCLSRLLGDFVYIVSVLLSAGAFISLYSAWQEFLTVRYYKKNPDQFERDLALYRSMKHKSE